MPVINPEEKNSIESDPKVSHERKIIAEEHRILFVFALLVGMIALGTCCSTFDQVEIQLGNGTPTSARINPSQPTPIIVEPIQMSTPEETIIIPQATPIEVIPFPSPTITGITPYTLEP